MTMLVALLLTQTSPFLSPSSSSAEQEAIDVHHTVFISEKWKNKNEFHELLNPPGECTSLSVDTDISGSSLRYREFQNWHITSIAHKLCTSGTLSEAADQMSGAHIQPMSHVSSMYDHLLKTLLSLLFFLNSSSWTSVFCLLQKTLLSLRFFLNSSNWACKFYNLQKVFLYLFFSLDISHWTIVCHLLSKALN